MSDTYTDILRSEVDAILVGSNTVKIDNCVLKCKMPSLIKNSPIRVVLNKKLDLKINSKVFNNCKKFRTIIFTNNSSKKLDVKIQKKNVDVISLKKNDYNLENILMKLSKWVFQTYSLKVVLKFLILFLKKIFLTISISLEVVFFSGITGNKFLEGKINFNDSKHLKKFVKKFGDDSLEIYKNINYESF